MGRGEWDLVFCGAEGRSFVLSSQKMVTGMGVELVLGLDQRASFGNQRAHDDGTNEAILQCSGTSHSFTSSELIITNLSNKKFTNAQTN